MHDSKVVPLARLSTQKAKPLKDDPKPYQHLLYISSSSVGFFLSALWGLAAFLALALNTRMNNADMLVLTVPIALFGLLAIGTLLSSITDHYASDHSKTVPLDDSYVLNAFLGYALIALGIAICTADIFISIRVIKQPSFVMVWLAQASAIPCLYGAHRTSKNWPKGVSRRVYVAYLASKFPKPRHRAKGGCR